MTLNEFRFWLEGFEESFSGSYNNAPSREQWAKIKERIGAITDESCTHQRSSRQRIISTPDPHFIRQLAGDAQAETPNQETTHE